MICTGVASSGGVTSGWKSKLLASISLLLVSKSDFLAADQLSLRSPAAPVTGSFLYMPPRATAFTVLLLPQAIQCRDGPTGLAVPACSFFGSLTGLRRAFSRIGITPSVVINQPDLELA